ncbi:MAG: lysozyme [Pseudomonadota bacterium]
MKLISNWKTVIARAHSMWAVYLGILLLFMPDLIYWTTGVDTNPRIWIYASLCAFLYGAVFRLCDQGIDRTKLESHWLIVVAGLALLAMVLVPHLRAVDLVVETPLAEPEIVEIAEITGVPDVAADPEQAFLAAAVPFIGRWEGLRLDAYQDIVGVWTVCYGETKGVKPGDRYTRAECDAMLAREVLSYRTGLHRHFLTETVESRLPVPRDVAFTSLAYNVGVAGAGRSTAVRRLNDGSIAGACDALTWWNKAGGRVVRGLVNRRSEEKAMCLEGVA